MEVKIRFQNVMYVDGEFLGAHQPEKLKEALDVGHVAIVEAIDKIYDNQAEIHREDALKYPLRQGVHPVQRAAIWVMKLAHLERGVRVSPGLDQEQPDTTHNTEIITSKDVLHPRFYDHWEAVESARFIPEVRYINPGIASETNGYFLAVRDVPLLSKKELTEQA